MGRNDDIRLVKYHGLTMSEDPSAGMATHRNPLRTSRASASRDGYQKLTAANGTRSMRLSGRANTAPPKSAPARRRVDWPSADRVNTSKPEKKNSRERGSVRVARAS